MTALKVLRFLREQKIYPVRPEHLVYEFGMKHNTALRVLNRMSENNVVPKLCRGLWWNPFYPPPNPLCLHKTIAPDSYISLITALWWHGIISQRPYTITCVRPGQDFSCTNEYGKYEFIEIPDKMFFGYHLVKEHCFSIADKEKALLDYLYVSKYVKKIEPRHNEFDLEGLSHDKLANYAEKMGPKMVRLLEKTDLFRTAFVN